MIIDPKKPAASGASPAGATKGGAARGGVVKDGDTKGFAEDVVKASMTVPVVVDFWAPWCGPCKTLTPLLERLVQQAGGKVRLVKIDIDQNQSLAAQLRIQSVPTVYAFVEGRPVDAFVGAQPESKVRAFIERLTRAAGSPVDEILQLAKESLDAGDDATSAELFAQALQHDPRHPKALAGSIRARIASGDLRRARSLVKGIPADLAADADVASAIAALDILEDARKSAGDVGALRRKVTAAPDDLQARFELAGALFAQGVSEAAIDELLHIVRADRGWNDEAARKQLVRIFEVVGLAHPVSVAGRRRLSSILFS